MPSHDNVSSIMKSSEFQAAHQPKNTEAGNGNKLRNRFLKGGAVAMAALALAACGTKANKQPGDKLTFSTTSASASNATNETSKPSSKPVSPTDVPSATSTKEVSPSSSSKEALPQPSLTELNSLAQSGELIHKPIAWRARWASQYNLGLKQSPVENESNGLLGAVQDNVAHTITSQDYQLNMSPSVDDDGQTTMNNFLFAKGALDSGFLQWVKESDGSTALRSNLNEGVSYFSTMWVLDGVNGDINTTWMNTSVSDVKAHEDIPGYVMPVNLPDDYTVSKTTNYPDVIIDGQKCPTRVVTAQTESGVTENVQWAYYQYVDANGEPATGAAIYSISQQGS